MLNAINDNKVAVGCTSTGSCYITEGIPVEIGEFFAVVWDMQDGLKHLSDLIDESLGWNLDNAITINNKGQILIEGSDRDGNRGFLLLTPTQQF